MKPIYKRRLLKLAKHLESGKLGHEKFDFDIVSNSSGPKCGTAGCAMGELPIVFPRQWKWGHAGEPELRGVIGSVFCGAREFFGLSVDERDHLFVPHEQLPGYFGGTHLTGSATRHQVAANIRAFVKRKEAV